MAIQRQTASVKALWQQFEENSKALSVVELVKQLKQNMNKTTVYRILERFEKQGKLHSFTGIDGLTWYAKCSTCTSGHHIDLHPHFQCNDCGKVECLDVELQVPPVKNHKIKSAQVLLTGQCEDCLQ